MLKQPKINFINHIINRGKSIMLASIALIHWNSKDKFTYYWLKKIDYISIGLQSF